MHNCRHSDDPTSWCFLVFFSRRMADNARSEFVDTIGNVKYNLNSLWTSPSSVLERGVLLKVLLRDPGEKICEEITRLNMYLAKAMFCCAIDIFCTEMCSCVKWFESYLPSLLRRLCFHSCNNAKVAQSWEPRLFLPFSRYSKNLWTQKPLIH